MLGEIEQLLNVQRVDQALHDASSHVDRLRAHRQQLEERIRREQANVSALADRLRQMEIESHSKNLEVDNLDMNIRSYQKRLNEGIISFKEMEDLRTKIDLEKARISQLEDEALDGMESLEGARADLSGARADLGGKEDVLRAQIAEVDRQIEAALAHVAAVETEREGYLVAAPAYLLAQYSALRAKFPNPIATLDHGTCSGCKLRVSGNTAERVRGGMGIVTCEHCSRILYLSSD
ncbi:MAG: zinc ribbon domain-containing protein [Candidatus Bipolaricaulia bacterium]